MVTPQWEMVKEGIRKHAEMNPVTRYDELRAAYSFSVYIGEMTEEEAHDEVMKRLTEGENR